MTDRKNPFTRESLTLEELNEYNNISENKDIIEQLIADIKEWEKERDEVLRECVKLAKLVEELRDAIEEPKELDDK